jgi:uncharacterized protein
MIDQQTAVAPAALDPQALQDIVTGSCILGSGGGGPLTLGKAMAEMLAEPGAPPVQVVPADGVADDASMAISAAFGSPDAAGGANPSGLAAVALGAYDTLAQATGTSFTHVVLGEIGAGNSLIPMLVAQEKNLPVVDASGAPRAMPLLANCVLADPSSGVPVSPLAFSNGKQSFTATAPNAELADPMLRGIVSQAGLFPEFGGLALWRLDGSSMKSRMLAGTLSRAQQLGEVLRTAPEGEKVEAVRAFLHGTLLFVGNHIEAQEQTGGGFDVNVITLHGLDHGPGLVIYGENENLIAWRTDRSTPLAMAPDLICYVTEDGTTFSNATPDITKVGKTTKVAVIGVPAERLGYATEWVRRSFAPLLRQLGYPGKYVPLEG